MRPAASVIIPARDAADTLGATLAGLAAQQGGPEFEVILVDDGSTDATAAVAKAAPIGVTVLISDGQGPAAARNAGAAAARGDLLAFLDADCEPEPGWSAQAFAALEHADLVAGRVIPDPEAPRTPFDRTLHVDREAGFYETANLWVRRELFESLGGFESWLGATTGKELAEDLWLGWRARRTGARTAFCETAVVRHAVFARNPIDYAAERARLRFFPAIVRRVPEMRAHSFYGRAFLSRRSAEFDLALVGTAMAVITGRRAPLMAAAPYARRLARDAAGWPGQRAKVALTYAAADAVGAAALIVGSIRARTPLL